MKIIFPIIIVLFLFFQGCGGNDNPTQPSPSIEDQINAQRPINSIVVYIGDPKTAEDVFLKQNPWDKDLLDASAGDGYLNVKSSFGTWKYNLSKANYIRIGTNSVELDY